MQKYSKLFSMATVFYGNLCLVKPRHLADNLKTAMMVLRILGDLSDATILATSTSRSDVQKKILAATLGWAALNTAALVADSRALKG